MNKKIKGMIPIFVPHMGCPHICVFCNQNRIAETVNIPNGDTVRHIIAEYTAVQNNQHKREWEIAFYGGTFTAIPIHLQKELLEPSFEAKKQGLIKDIRCSTRPDDLEEDHIALLQKYGVNVVEIGVQSMDLNVLEASKRGHTPDDVKNAVQRLKKHGFKIGLQLMPGLPSDNLLTIVTTTVEIAKLKPDFVRIYPVLVIEDTELANSYQLGSYKPLTMEQALNYASFMKKYFNEKNIQVIRMGLQATEGLDRGETLLAGPYSPSFGEEVISYMLYDKLKFSLCLLGEMYTYQNIRIEYPRNLTSKVLGLKSTNKIKLNNIFKNGLKWQENNNLPNNLIRLSNNKTTTYITCI